MATRILVDRNVQIRMRDGIHLSADIYRPDSEIGVPAILVRLPYNKDDLWMHMEAVAPIRAASCGYAVIYQDTRGRYTSEGTFYPFTSEGQDGYDTIEWIAAQPWCSGAVGMSGASYFGATQWLAAVEQPPHLKAIFPVVTSSEYYEGWTYQGGAFQLGFILFWVLMGFAPDTALRLAKAGVGDLHAVNRLLAAVDHMEDHYRHLPLASLPLLCDSQAASYYSDWLKHESNDDFWRTTAINRNYNRIQVPACNVGAWYDLFLHGTLENYVRMQHEGGSQAARQGQRLLVTPWAHGNFTGEFPEYRFGQTAAAGSVDLCGQALQFFDHHLKGQKNLDEEHPVRIFVMGVNSWRDETSWPLSGTKYVPWYLHDQGGLSPQYPLEEPPDSYLYDPHHPAPTIGGSTFLPGLRSSANAGPLDQRPLENRPDVLAYTSDPLTEPLEVTGPLVMKLWASSSAVDTDFVAKLCDVYPDGTSRILAEGILRARYRKGCDRAVWLSPGEVELFEINLVATSNVFLPGHRIRVDITSSSFPRFNVHPNTSHALANYTSVDFNPAFQNVFHDSDHPSHIILPVISRA